VAATVLAAVATPLLARDADPAPDGTDLVATQGPAPVPEAPRGWWDMPATEMVGTVEAILPDGVTVTAPGPLEADTPEGGPAHGWINVHLTGSAGPGRLNVSLYPEVAEGAEGDEGDELVVTASEPSSDIGCGAEHSGRTTCVQIHDDRGTVIGRRLTNRWGGTLMTEVVLRRDGGTVYAASANTLDDKWGADSPVSAQRPPLTLDQLEDLVRNDAWVSYRP